MTETLCTSGSVKIKAGANVSTAITGVVYTELINQAESDIVVEIREDVVAGYSGYTDAKKKILEDACASKAAMSAIGYDMSGYTSSREAETLLDINWNNYTNSIKKLKDKIYTDFLIGA